MTEKNAANTAGLKALKSSLKSGEFSGLYLIYGEESYLKEYYLQEMKKKIVDDAFADFNLIELEGKELTPDTLVTAVESCPVMAEKKLIIIYDFDLYKPPASFQSILSEMLSDLPPYDVLIFYYDIIPFKPDKRVKIHHQLEKLGCFVSIDRQDDRTLSAWIQRRFRALGKEISPELCEYLIFLCGNSMTNLTMEIEKAAAHSTLPEIKKYNIDAVCTRTLDAVVFDLTDAITNKKFDTAIFIVNDLLSQKNSEVTIFSTVIRHIVRLYSAKLHLSTRKSNQELMTLLGSRSTYFVQKICNAARSLPLSWLRQAVLICAETDAALKSSSADKQKLVELGLLQLASSMEELKT